MYKRQLYKDSLSVKEKLEKIAKEIYGADGVTFSAAAEKNLREIEQLGAEKFPVCVAKTQYSLSDDPSLLGRPSGFRISVRELKVCLGAEFIVAYTGEIMTMPGLPKRPAAFDIDVSEKGEVLGLF